MVHQDRFTVQTGGHRDMHDITGQVAEIVAASEIRIGVAHVFNVGSTGVVGTIEFEPGLQGDLPEMLDKLMPPSRHYGHELAWHDGTGHSPCQKSALPGVRGKGITSRMLVIPVTNWISRSRPKPKPAWGTVPYRRRS